MQLLAQCRLSIDGIQVELEWAPEAASPEAGSLLFHFKTRSRQLLPSCIGHVGVVASRSGIVLTRMRLLHVDFGKDQLRGELIRKEEACPPITRPSRHAGFSPLPTTRSFETR